MSRYKKSLIIFLFFYITAIASFSIISFMVTNVPRITSLFPGDNMIIQITIIFGLFPIAAIIGGFFIGYILGPFFIIIYKNTVGIRMNFGIQHRDKTPKFNRMWKSVFPSLMAINFALMIGTSTFAKDFIVSPEYLSSGGAQWPIIGFITVLPLMLRISYGIFSPVWFLLDSGIVFTNKRKVKDKVDPVEVRSLGGWYLYLLKGYAGIGVIISYIGFVTSMLALYKDPFDAGFISAVILLPILPIILSIYAVPIQILLDYTLEHRRKFMLRFAEKLRIVGPLEDPLDINI